MRQKTFILLGVAFLGYCATSNANITNAWWQNDNDGAINCQQYGTFNGSSLSMTGDQYWGPGHMTGWIQTDTTSDPTLGLYSSVDNDTSFAWTSYVVNVYMAVPFSFVGTPAVTTPGWSVSYSTSGTAPDLPGGEFPSEPYEATIDFTTTTPLAIGDELDFNYAIHFASSTDYAFTQEMIPVPEPSDLGLASGFIFGAFQLVKRLRKKA
ncbi:MAG: hypothetical protein ACLQU4_10265 [Limisphaerales bacterium]